MNRRENSSGIDFVSQNAQQAKEQIIQHRMRQLALRAMTEKRILEAKSKR